MDQEHFLNLLVHHWHNLKQAQMWPSSFAYVHYQWYYDEDGSLRSRQWYDWNSEVYRTRRHVIVPKRDHFILETYNGDLKSPDTIITQAERGYLGHTYPGAINAKGYRVETKFTLTEDSFETDDKGWNEKGELVWGSKKGPFSFIRCTKSIPTTVSSLK